jgi:peptide/nickel transport system permease protein
MNRYIKKLMFLLISIFLVSVFTFVAFQIIPGDSASTMLGMNATEEAVEALREELGLNKNVVVRYGNWVKDALRGDFGTSLQYKVPVKTLIADRLPVTIWLGVLSILLIIIIAIPLGILSTRKEGGMGEGLILSCIHTVMAIPPFFLGILITLVFGIILKWFTPGGYVSPSEDFRRFFKFMIFPALSIAIPQIAMLIKFLRGSLLRELQLDYVRTAKSKGSTNTRILYRHVLKNALITIITFLGMVLADVLAGSIIIEQVFGLPGLGRLLITSISNRDFMVVQGIILYIVITVVCINFVVDIIYQRIDPRIRL